MSHCPSKEDHLAVCGLRDAQLLTLNSSGQVITRENMHPSVGANGHIVKVTHFDLALLYSTSWQISFCCPLIRLSHCVCIHVYSILCQMLHNANFCLLQNTSFFFLQILLYVSDVMWCLIMSQMLWVPGQTSELLLISDTFVKLYNTKTDIVSPSFYFELPMGKIRDATVAITDQVGEVKLLYGRGQNSMWVLSRMRTWLCDLWGCVTCDDNIMPPQSDTVMLGFLSEDY